MRILTVSDVSALTLAGGAERVLGEVTGRLAARGHAVRILSRAPADGAARGVRRGTVEVVEFASSRRSVLGFLRSAVQEARRAASVAAEDVAELAVFLELADVLYRREGETAWKTLRRRKRSRRHLPNTATA